MNLRGIWYKLFIPENCSNGTAESAYIRILSKHYWRSSIPAEFEWERFQLNQFQFLLITKASRNPWNTVNFKSFKPRFSSVLLNTTWKVTFSGTYLIMHSCSYLLVPSKLCQILKFCKYFSESSFKAVILSNLLSCHYFRSILKCYLNPFKKYVYEMRILCVNLTVCRINMIRDYCQFLFSIFFTL